MKAPSEPARVCFRIGPAQWMSPGRFEALLRLFEKYRGVTDEVMLFAQDTHAPLPLTVIAERVEVMRARLHSARQAGLRAGLETLTTIGHHEENLPHSLVGQFTPLTDTDGRVCRGAFCPNDARHQGYVRQLFEQLTRAEPDFLWVDDDVRLFGHKPLVETCFCDHCLWLFQQETGMRYDRDALRRAFHEGPLDQKLRVRRAWLQHNRDTITRVLELVERTVHARKPGLPLGFMSGERYYEGYDFARWAETLSGPQRAPVLWRPAGGFYNDDSPRRIVDRSQAIGRQVSLLPDAVVSIQSEIEHFPYQRLNTSAHATGLEAAAHLAAGCTGTAFNVLTMYDEPLDEYEPLVRQLQAARPFQDRLVSTFGRTHPQGLFTGWNRHSFAAVNPEQGTWFDPEFWRMMGEFANEVLDLGLPAAYRLADASVTLLTSNAPLAWEKEELLQILSAGVYLDAVALERLNRSGYAHLTGFEIARWVAADTLEEFTSDPLNGSFAGRRRDGRQSFWDCPAALLKPCSEATRTLARAVNYANAEVGACCMGLFENELGGRVCVAGYYPWRFLQNLSKSSQIKAVMRWLSKDRLPAWVESFHRIQLWVREPEPGRPAIALLNASLDPAEEVTLLVRTPREQVRLFDMRGTETCLDAGDHAGDYRKFRLPPIGPWEMGLLIG